jgi:hypothetical protein
LRAHKKALANLEVFKKIKMLEILKRARGHSDGDMATFGRPPSGLQAELNHRTWKAGYTDRDGQQKTRLAEIVSKPPTEKYRENYVKIFGHD